MVIIIEIDLVSQVQILIKAVCVSLEAMSFGRSWNQSFLSQLDRLGFLVLVRKTGPWKEKLWIQTIYQSGKENFFCGETRPHSWESESVKQWNIVFNVILANLVMTPRHVCITPSIFLGQHQHLGVEWPTAWTSIQSCPGLWPRGRFIVS